MENIGIAQDILENMNTTQDALSGTGYNVYSFALMFRPPGLHTYVNICNTCLDSKLVYPACTFPVHKIYIVLVMHLHTTLRKTSSLSVHWKTKGNPPVALQALRRDNPLHGTSALVHWGDWDWDTDKLLERVKPIVRDNCTGFTLKVSTLPLSEKQKEKKELAKGAFYSLCKEDVVMELGAKCQDYIVMYTGTNNFLNFNNKHQSHDHLRKHPLMMDVMVLSDMALRVFDGSSDLEKVISEENVIYVALFYLNDTPAYYVGKASGGIRKRWRTHFNAVNRIIHNFETAPGDFEPVVEKQACDMAIASAILRQVATRHEAGMALFAIEFCPKGNVECSDRKANLCQGKKYNQGSKRSAIDHHEQHYINAFSELFPDSDTEPRMKCLNAMSSCISHHCSDGNVHGCSIEVALRLFLHELQ